MPGGEVFDFTPSSKILALMGELSQIGWKNSAFRQAPKKIGVEAELHNVS
jgi:hypothetical protein